MLWVACAGLWLALSASFAVSASIIGMPSEVIVFEIVRVTLLIGAAAGAAVGARAFVHGWRRANTADTSV